MDLTNKLVKVNVRMVNSAISVRLGVESLYNFKQISTSEYMHLVGRPGLYHRLNLQRARGFTGLPSRGLESSAGIRSSRRRRIKNTFDYNLGNCHTNEVIL
jgi:hypothetical protein